MLKILMIGSALTLTLAGCTGYRTTTREVVVVDPNRTSNQVAYNDQRYDGCSDNAALGTVTGAVVGGVIGNQFGNGADDRAAATIGGVILGGIAGNAIARGNCDNQRADAYYYNDTYYDAFDDAGYGRRHEWRNPYSGRYGYVTPIRNVDGYSYGYDDECREFEQIVYVDGVPYTDTGIACRDRDGAWRIVSS